MAKKTPPSRKPEKKRFVQILRYPSVGVEVSTGRTWVGVDQQIGHGSADALFALTEEQYPLAYRDELGSFLGECWRRERDDLILFDPNRGGGWYPEHWNPAPERTPPERFVGELWRHIDALGQPGSSEAAETSRALARRPSPLRADSDVVDSLTFAFTGDAAYPRPAGLIIGLTFGSDRAVARTILGEPMEGGEDVFAAEDAYIRLAYVDGGLSEITVTRAIAGR